MERLLIESCPTKKEGAERRIRPDVMRRIAIAFSVVVAATPFLAGRGSSRFPPSGAVINKQHNKGFRLSSDAIIEERSLKLEGHMLVTGKKVETIVDDDEGLSSFYVAWLEAGGYFSVEKESGENVIYVELNDQSNGFYSKTVKYTIADRRIKFRLSDDEYFDRPNRINEIEIVIPDEGFNIKEISTCLKFIFGSA